MKGNVIRKIKLLRCLLFEILVFHVVCFYRSWRFGYKAHVFPSNVMEMIRTHGIHKVDLQLGYEQRSGSDTETIRIPTEDVVKWMDYVTFRHNSTDQRNRITNTLKLEDNYFYWIKNPRPH